MAGAYHKVDATVSARDGVPVTTNDSTVIPVTRALYVGVSGNLTVHMAGGPGGPQAASVLYSNVPVGIFPIQVDMVFATGTSASSIVALY